jgi:hypothetical protein
LCLIQIAGVKPMFLSVSGSAMPCRGAPEAARTRSYHSTDNSVVRPTYAAKDMNTLRSAEALHQQQTDKLLIRVDPAEGAGRTRGAETAACHTYFRLFRRVRADDQASPCEIPSIDVGTGVARQKA